jgi:LAS superfamily LD-carboxypeptidase LdcB
MPRGDYNAKFRGKFGMNQLPSHNCVYVPQDNPEQFDKNWESAGLKTTPLKQMNKKYECTCNSREEQTPDGHFIVEDTCKLHNTKGRRIKIKVTDAPKHFPKHHMDKVRDYVIYGDRKMRDVREITDRN